MTAEAIRCKHCRAPYIPPVSRPDFPTCMRCTLGGPKAGKLALQLAAVEKLPPMEQPANGFAFRVPGQPLSQNRVYRRRSQGYGMYLTDEGQEWKTILSNMALAARPRGWDVRGKYWVNLLCVFSNAACDADNVVKLVLDAMQGVAYVRDSQVVTVTSTKRVDKDAPRLEVEVRGAEGTAGRVG